MYLQNSSRLFKGWIQPSKASDVFKSFRNYGVVEIGSQTSSDVGFAHSDIS